MHDVHKQKTFIHFGDSRNAWMPDEYLEKKEAIFDHPSFLELQHTYGIQDFKFLHQQHTIHGYAVDSTLKPFATIGDYLITNVPRIALGIMTADCLPVIAIDRINNNIGIAHAGWRGAVGGIVPVMLAHMQAKYSIHMPSVEIVFGPSARVCCYQVDQLFVNNNKDILECLEQRNSGYYFDLIKLIKKQLQLLNIQSFNDGSAHCTICNPQFCSYRREKDLAKRQMSLVGMIQ